MELFTLENGLNCVQIGVFLTKFGHRLLLSLSASCVKELEKIIAWMLCVMHDPITVLITSCIKVLSDPITVLITMLSF